MQSFSPSASYCRSASREGRIIRKLTKISCSAVVSLHAKRLRLHSTVVCILHSCASAGTYAGSLSARTKLVQCHSRVPTGRTHYNFSYALHGQRKNWSKSWKGDLALYRDWKRSTENRPGRDPDLVPFVPKCSRGVSL